MKIVFRADAAPELGSGHAVRCLTLADALAARGHACEFLARRMPELLRAQILAQEHQFQLLPDLGVWAAPLEMEWSDAQQAADAASVIAACGPADWVVCDQYGLGVPWERAVRAQGKRVLALDDMGRQHACDVLLDQNFYSDPASRYAPESALHMLIGPRYALLRPEFAVARLQVAPRQGAVRQMLLFMSGTDAGDATSLALDAIEVAGLAGIALDVVVGAGHPALATITARCAVNSTWTLHVQTHRMAELLAAADLAIGAGGSATWERCALGVPALAVELATNQAAILAEGDKAGFLLSVGQVTDAESLAQPLRALADDASLRHHMSSVAMGITDGRGAERVAEALEIS